MEAPANWPVAAVLIVLILAVSGCAGTLIWQRQALDHAESVRRG